MSTEIWSSDHFPIENLGVGRTHIFDHFQEEGGGEGGSMLFGKYHHYGNWYYFVIVISVILAQRDQIMHLLLYSRHPLLLSLLLLGTAITITEQLQFPVNKMNIYSESFLIFNFFIYFLFFYQIITVSICFYFIMHFKWGLWNIIIIRCW